MWRRIAATWAAIASPKTTPAKRKTGRCSGKVHSSAAVVEPCVAVVVNPELVSSVKGLEAVIEVADVVESSAVLTIVEVVVVTIVEVVVEVVVV
jgi:hypothetical protein